MRIVYFGHATAYDYQEMYKALVASNINKKYELVLPHLNHLNKNSLEIIKSSDIVVAEVSLPSTGLGIEMGWASLNKIPIVCVHKKGIAVGSSLKNITKDFMAYKDLPDMVSGLEAYLGKRFG